MKLLHLIELVGAMPTVTRAVVAKLIPKIKATGLVYRSIGLMASLSRQCAAAGSLRRAPGSPAIKTPFWGTSRGAVSWRSCTPKPLRLKLANSPSRSSTPDFFFWDLQIVYEYLSRDKLWSRSEELGFNLGIVAVALNQYAAKRFLGLGALTMECAYARRGIAAGCGMATTWVQIYALPPLRLWRVTHPWVSLTMFIDDLGGGTSAKEEHLVVGRLAAAAASL